MIPEVGADIGYMDTTTPACRRQHLRRHPAVLRTECPRRRQLRRCPVGNAEKVERINRHLSAFDALHDVCRKCCVVRPVAASQAIVQHELTYSWEGRIPLQQFGERQIGVLEPLQLLKNGGAIEKRGRMPRTQCRRTVVTFEGFLTTPKPEQNTAATV